MGCSNSKSTATTTAIDDIKMATIKPNKMADTPKQEYPVSEAFTIPLDDDVSSATVQLNETLREPPKRLQQLMQLAAESEPLTIQELEEKQQRAEQRRQELMQIKIETIQKNTQMLMRGHVGEGRAENSADNDNTEGQATDN